MLPIRAFLARPALRLFHSSTSRFQQQDGLDQQGDASVSTAANDPSFDKFIDDVESSPSSHRGATVSPIVATDPGEVFDAWKTNSFYAPLAFLRSRRIRAPPKRAMVPKVGPGAAEAAHNDVFRQLDIDPVHEANNQMLLSNFISSMGRIRPRAQTRLSWRSQRMVTRAIKRSKQKGILSITGRSWYFVPRTQVVENDKS